MLVLCLRCTQQANDRNHLSHGRLSLCSNPNGPWHDACWCMGYDACIGAGHACDVPPPLSSMARDKAGGIDHAHACSMTGIPWATANAMSLGQWRAQQASWSTPTLAHSHAAWPMLRQHAWGMNALGLLPSQLGTRIPKVVHPRRGGNFIQKKRG